MKSISYPLGFLLGYLFNLAIFYVIIITSDMILNLKKSTSLIILLNIIKLAIEKMIKPIKKIKNDFLKTNFSFMIFHLLIMFSSLL